MALNEASVDFKFIQGLTHSKLNTNPSIGIEIHIVILYVDYN